MQYCRHRCLLHPTVILDEVQYAPSLLPYIKESIDGARRVKGGFLLTGSQNLMMMEQVTESLAGRAAVLRLLPLSAAEACGMPAAAFPWEGPRPAGEARDLSGSELWRHLLRGGFPELWAEPTREAGLWFASYVQTYLERDLRQLRQIGDLSQFQSFLRALAARSAQLFNATELGRDLGLATNTVRAWVSVLEATHQVVTIRPYHANIGKRLVKTPKIYFTDVGLLCHLVGLRDPRHAASGPMAGAIFETAVLLEALKRQWNRGDDNPIYFWRTATGIEVDLLVSRGDRLVPVETKTAATPRPPMARGLLAVQRDLPECDEEGFVVHTGDVRVPLAPSVTAIPFGDW